MGRISISCDASGPIGETDRLAQGPDTDVFEGIMMGAYAAVEARVHVLTGRLKQSGAADSVSEEGSWTGTIHFARHPGIFELARGDTPTLNHPEGQHHFYEPAYKSPEAYKAALMDFITGEAQK